MRLKHPLALRLSFEEGTWFLENDALSVFGHGQSAEEAVTEFLHDLRYLLQRYRSLSEDELSGTARKLKERLASLTE